MLIGIWQWIIDPGLPASEEKDLEPSSYNTVALWQRESSGQAGNVCSCMFVLVYLSQASHPWRKYKEFNSYLDKPVRNCLHAAPNTHHGVERNKQNRDASQVQQSPCRCRGPSGVVALTISSLDGKFSLIFFAECCGLHTFGQMTFVRGWTFSPWIEAQSWQKSTQCYIIVALKWHRCCMGDTWISCSSVPSMVSAKCIS